jgi:hypothetical protein
MINPTMRAFSCAVALLLLASVNALAQSLPGQLSDAAFWQLIEEISEPDGSFNSENLVSNELYAQHVLPTLKSSIAPGGVYLGVGPEQNFTYIATLEPKIAFIIDIRRQNMLEILMYKALFELADNRADFVSLLFSRKLPEDLNNQSTVAAIFDALRTIDPDPALRAQTMGRIRELLVKKHEFGLVEQDLATVEHVHQQFFEFGPGLNYNSGTARASGEGITYEALMTATDMEGLGRPGLARSFLATESSYLFVKSMHTKNLILPVVGDFAGPKAVRSVARFLEDHGAVVSVFYISNVEGYLMNTEQKKNTLGAAYFNNVAALPLDSGSKFIRACSSRDLPRRGYFISKVLSIQDRIAAFRQDKVLNAGEISGCPYSE